MTRISGPIIGQGNGPNTTVSKIFVWFSGVFRRRKTRVWWGEEKKPKTDTRLAPKIVKQYWPCIQMVCLLFCVTTGKSSDGFTQGGEIVITDLNEMV